MWTYLVHRECSLNVCYYFYGLSSIIAQAIHTLYLVHTAPGAGLGWANVGEAASYVGAQALRPGGLGSNP